MNLKNFTIKKCIICGEEYLVRLKPKHRVQARTIRPINSITCKKKVCSGIYIRVYERAMRKIKQRYDIKLKK